LILLYTYLAYTHPQMNAAFIELPAFERRRADYLDDEQFQALPWALMGNPEAGDVLPATGGLRELRFGDPRRQQRDDAAD
jgi:hypothetical protein